MTVATAGSYVLSDRSRERNGARKKHTSNKGKIKEYFGVSREIDFSRSPIFSRLLTEIPDLSERAVRPENVKKPYLALANHGLVKDIIRRKNSRKTIKSQKDIRAIAGNLKGLVAGRGNPELSIDLRHMKVEVITNDRKAHIGALVIASIKGPIPGMSGEDIDSHNEIVTDVSDTASAIHRRLMNVANSSSRMSPLEGRIDLFCATDYEVARETMDKIHEFGQRLDRSYDTSIVMQPADVYWVRAR